MSSVPHACNDLLSLLVRTRTKHISCDKVRSDLLKSFKSLALQTFSLKSRGEYDAHILTKSGSPQRLQFSASGKSVVADGKEISIKFSICESIPAALARSLVSHQVELEYCKLDSCVRNGRTEALPRPLRHARDVNHSLCAPMCLSSGLIRPIRE